MIFFEIAFCLLLYQAFIIILHSDSPHPWLVGDWLINYQGGFVRRGLIGEIALQISLLSSIDIVILIVAFQMFLYLVFLINAYKLSSNSPFSALSTALIFSPAFILFPILDPIGSFRKEILLFAILSTLCFHLSVTDTKITRRLQILVGLAAVFVALSHEMLIVYFPYVIAAFIIHEGGLSSRAKNGILAIVPAIAITILVMIFSRGDRQTVIQICNSLKPNTPPDCIYPGVVSGAISFLGENLISAHAFVIESLNSNTLFAYSITTVLALIPLALMYFSNLASALQKNVTLKFWLTVCVLTAMAGSIPLFWVVADYGRLIYIHITCITLLMLMGIQEKDGKPLQFTSRQVFSWLLVFVYVISWRLIHWKASMESAFPITVILGRLFNL